MKAANGQADKYVAIVHQVKNKRVYEWDIKNLFQYVAGIAVVR